MHSLETGSFDKHMWGPTIHPVPKEIPSKTAMAHSIPPNAKRGMENPGLVPWGSMPFTR